MSLSINNVRLDDPTRPYIIAELSGNHGQNYAQAMALVRAAAEAGADAVKVQTFTPEEICADVPILFGHDARHDAWCRQLGVTRMRELFAKGGFPRQWHADLKAYAEHTCGVEFLSTPFSLDALRFLVEEVGVRAIKIASGDLTFRPLLEAAGATQLPVLLSTGGATVDEIYTAVRVGHMGYGLLIDQLALLHCVSSYPCPDEAANLRAIGTIQARFHHCQVVLPTMGWSDHTLSVSTVPMLALACGATLFEKHLTLDRADGMIDSLHSLEPHEFKVMVTALRNAARIVGTGEKVPTSIELHDKAWGRRDPSDWLRPTQAAREGQWA